MRNAYSFKRSQHDYNISLHSLLKITMQLALQKESNVSFTFCRSNFLWSTAE